MWTVQFLGGIVFNGCCFFHGFSPSPSLAISYHTISGLFSSLLHLELIKTVCMFFHCCSGRFYSRNSVLLVQLALAVVKRGGGGGCHAPRRSLRGDCGNWDKICDNFRCMQISFVMSMQFIFGDDWIMMLIFAVWQWWNFPESRPLIFVSLYARVLKRRYPE